MKKNDEWSSVANLEEMKKKLMIAASETTIKDYKINVRISKKGMKLP
ncbi:MAG TPA: hypothetical protein PK595_05260 [Bacteroidota bacterium]|nr:hypothetical protein [Bacteroidota bacterium]